MPVVIAGKDFDVFLLKVVLGVRSMLHDGRFVEARCRLGSGEMFSIPRGCCTGSFPNVIVSAWYVVRASVVYYHAIDIDFVNFVFRMD